MGIYNMSNLLNSPIVKFVLIGTIIALIIWLIWRKYQAIIRQQELEPLYIRKPVNAKKPGSNSNQLVPLPRTGEGYSLSVWIWVNDWEYRLDEWKHILHKGDKDASSVQPGVWFHPRKNKILVRFDRKGRGDEFRFKENQLYTSLADSDINTSRKVFVTDELLNFASDLPGNEKKTKDDLASEITSTYPKISFG